MVHTFIDGMTQGPQSRTSQQLKNEREVRKYQDELGNSEAVARLIDRYGKVSTRRVYLVSLVLYFRWLKSLGVVMSPDELVTDNLTCVFHSDPADVRTKRKHTDWLSRYVNQWMVDQGYSESMREVTTAAVQQFYKKNDSPLFGDFGVSRSSPEPATDPLEPVDVRKVLMALPLQHRLPLLIMWQSGIEIGRVLGLRWQDVEGIERGIREGTTR